MEDHKPVNITQLTILEDGTWFDEHDHFGVRFTNSSDVEDVNEARRKMCAFKILNILNKDHLKTFGEKALWHNLGIQVQPYAEFENFVNYLQIQSHELCPEVIPKVEEEYKGKCEGQGIFNGESLFSKGRS